MQKTDKITAGEISLTLGLIIIFGLVWMKWPVIKVSSKTLESYNLSDPNLPSWSNGIGLSLSAKPVDAPSLDAPLQPYRDLISRYNAYIVNVRIEGASYPTMIDLPYDRARLTDAAGREYRCLNRSVAEQTSDPKLKQMLEVFDWSIVNNTFTKQERLETGLLLFEPGEAPRAPLSLYLNFYHHPYKQVDIKFDYYQSTIDQARSH
ncbi:MAG TPA: hypothetical protein VKC34_15425 [Blastocatellia bacterium]|nr:hypothetical protein [Blastocatellia bacterium]